jgi:Na+/H+ antiporter NhaC
LLPSGTARAAILAGALLGALVLLVAEFTALYTVNTATSTTVQTVGTGSNDSYALVPLAVLAGVLGIAVFRAGSRPALLAIGIVGVVALLIALLGDLPDAHATGLVGSAESHFVSARTTPSAGLYLETLGAVMLIATCVLGFIGLGRPQPVRRPRQPPQEGDRPRRSVS